MDDAINTFLGYIDIVKRWFSSPKHRETLLLCTWKAGPLLSFCRCCICRVTSTVDSQSLVNSQKALRVLLRRGTGLSQGPVSRSVVSSTD